MSDDLLLFRSFVRVVEAGSFTAVAREANTSQPTISRQIAHLEEQLGCLLFARTTRALTLTDDGRVFYEHARRVLETVAEAQSAVGRRKGKPSGRLRLGAAVVMGRLHLVPMLPRFMERYPDVSVDLSLSDGFSDLVEEGIDVALRVGDIADTSLIARRIGTNRRIVVAARRYVEQRGRPMTPEDLKAHDCIVYSRLVTGSNWGFSAPGGDISIPITGRFHVNNTEGVRAAILGGLGIGYVPIWHFVDGEIESGRLVTLLPDYAPKPQPIHVVYPTRRFISPKVRAMVDFLAHEFALDARLSGYDA